MPSTQTSGLRLIGEIVTVSYVADPSVGHGQFRLENHDAGSVTAAVESGWLELGEQQQPLSGMTVFDVDLEQTVDPEKLKVAGKGTMTFLLGFPSVVYEPRFGEVTAIGLRLRVNATELHALSPVEFIRRIPRGH